MFAQPFNRRRFFKATSPPAAAIGRGRPGAAACRRSRRRGRLTATRRSSPTGRSGLTITVGLTKADLVGSSERVIQAAADYIARMGGGTVRLLPGTYIAPRGDQPALADSPLGSADSIITKIASETVALADDSNWFDQEITSPRPRAFGRRRRLCGRRIRTMAARGDPADARRPVGQPIQAQRWPARISG